MGRSLLSRRRPLAPIITLRPEQPPRRIDVLADGDEPRRPPELFDWSRFEAAGPRLLLVDEQIVRFALEHLEADQHPMYPVAHGEAITALRTAIGTRRR